MLGGGGGSCCNAPINGLPQEVMGGGGGEWAGKPRKI